MSPHLRRPGVATGVVLFALLAVVDVLSPWIYPAPASAPAFADALTLAFGVAALIALAVWIATSIRAAMWVGVVIRVIGGLFSIMAFLDPTVSTTFVVISAVYLAATIVGVVLVVPTLRARRSASSTAVA